MFKRSVLLSAGAALALVMAPATAPAANYGPGASDTEVKVGNINPYSGPASAYGKIGETISAYVKYINAKGGVNGRTIDYITLDDGYSPPKTVEQTRRLVEQDQVLFLFQTLGTPTNSAIHKYVNAKKVPHLFLATGASKWDQPEAFPWTMGWQPTYEAEGKIYAAYVLKNKPDAKIAILFQNDDYGKDYLDGFRAGLGDKADSMIVIQEPYEVSDPTVDAQIIKMKSAGADVFLNVTTPKFAAQAIRKAHEIGWQPLHFLNNVSSSVGSVLKPAGLEASTGVITAEYRMDPTDRKWADHPETVAFKAWMKENMPNADITDINHLYGYSAGHVLVEVIARAGDELTRENVMKVSQSFDRWRAPMLLPDVLITTGPDDHAPIEAMALYRFDGKGWSEFGPVIDVAD
jgi:branched-chain amino acid transport system substrate-binding protein